MINWEFHIGDLIASDEVTIAHGCNCDGVMGAGIAKQIKSEMPQVYREYVQAVPLLLGSAQYVWTGRRGVFNLMTQRRPGPDARLGAITMAFANMAEQMYHQSLDRVATPRIGCGIGGLHWDNVEQAIVDGINLSGISGITVAVYDLP